MTKVDNRARRSQKRSALYEEEKARKLLERQAQLELRRRRRDFIVCAVATALFLGILFLEHRVVTAEWTDFSLMLRLAWSLILIDSILLIVTCMYGWRVVEHFFDAEDARKLTVRKLLARQT